MSTVHTYFSSLFFLLFRPLQFFFFFFFNDTAPTEIYTLSLHDALPIYLMATALQAAVRNTTRRNQPRVARVGVEPTRSEEHTSELQSRFDLVCRLLLEKKKKKKKKKKIEKKKKQIQY